MIKFLGEKDGRPILGFGLSRGNCERLLKGKPIFIDLKVMMMDVVSEPNLNEATVLIFGGENEAELQKKLVGFCRQGPEKTKTHNEEN